MLDVVYDQSHRDTNHVVHGRLGRKTCTVGMVMYYMLPSWDSFALFLSDCVASTVLRGPWQCAQDVVDVNMYTLQNN